LYLPLIDSSASQASQLKNVEKETRGAGHKPFQVRESAVEFLHGQTRETSPFQWAVQPIFPGGPFSLMVSPSTDLC
jgi:hypothetical protein